MCPFGVVEKRSDRMGAGFFEAAAHYDADPEALKQLIAEQPNDLHRSDRAGLTLLHYACREGHLEAVEMLFEAGVPLEAQDRDARTPLHLACLMATKVGHTRGRDHLRITNFLLDRAGAATSTVDKYGHTPLSYLPQRLKSLGLMTEKMDGRSAVWSIEQVRRAPVRLPALFRAPSPTH